MIEWHEWHRYWRKRMPILDWLPKYDLKRDLKFDIIAGFTVAVMLVPQEMSFAALMGVPAQYGLYTAATAPLLYPLFGSSRALSVANAAEGSLLVGVMLRAVEIQSVEERVATGILLTFFSGLIMVCSGFLHQGGVVSFFSRTSMNGYITATALLIITSQFPGWLGITLHQKAPLSIFTVMEIIRELPNTNVHSFALGVFSIAWLSTTKRLKLVLTAASKVSKSSVTASSSSDDGTISNLTNEDVEEDDAGIIEIDLHKPNDSSSVAVAPMPPKDSASIDTKKTTKRHKQAAVLGHPTHSLTSFFASRPLIAFAFSALCDGSALTVCVVGMAVGAALGDETIKLTGVVPSGLPMSVFPPSALGGIVPWDRLQSILTNSAMIAVIFFMSSVATGSKLANQAGYEISPNQELLGLGFANLGSSFLQGMPSSAGMSRSAVNSQSAHTPLASMVTAVLIVVTLLFLTGPLYYLPQAPLAAIILLSALTLIDFTEPKWLKRVNKYDFYVWLAAFWGTLLCGLLQGLFISVTASLVAIMAKSKKPHVAELGQFPDGSFGEIKTAPDAGSSAIAFVDVVIVGMAHALYFGNVSHFIHGIEHKLQAAKDRGRILGIVVDGSRMNDIDSSAVHALTEYHHKLLSRDQQLTFANLTHETASSLLSSGLWEADGGNGHGRHERLLTGDIASAVAFLRGPEY